MKLMILLILILNHLVIAQNKDAEKIIEKIKANFDLINDYSVEVRGKVYFPDTVIP